MEKSPYESHFLYDHVRLHPKEQIDLHTQKSWEISWIIKGSGMRSVGDTTVPFTSGEVILIPPGMTHCWYFDDTATDRRGKTENVALFFTTELMRHSATLFPEMTPALEKLIARKEAIAFHGAHRERLIRLLRAMDDADDAARVPLLLQVWLAAAGADELSIAGRTSGGNRVTERLDAVRIFSISNIGRRISVERVAQHVGMNKAAFCTFFKQHTGKTYITYLNELRISRACELLAKGSMSVSEVCWACGFDGLPYFCRLFKRLQGCSPSEYSRSLQK